MDEHAEIHRIYVLEEYQGKKIGKYYLIKFLQ
jgi:GNAT superfamily N-acetyltransferase